MKAIAVDDELYMLEALEEAVSASFIVMTIKIVFTIVQMQKLKLNHY